MRNLSQRKIKHYIRREGTEQIKHVVQVLYFCKFLFTYKKDIIGWNQHLASERQAILKNTWTEMTNQADSSTDNITKFISFILGLPHVSRNHLLKQKNLGFTVQSFLSHPFHSFKSFKFYFLKLTLQWPKSLLSLKHTGLDSSLSYFLLTWFFTKHSQ